MMIKILVSCFAALLLPATLSSAQDYPSKVIKIVVPYEAGSGTDVAARIVGAHMAKTLGQPMVVQNMVGANAVIGTQFVARAAPDGYTIMFGSTTTHAANQSLLKKMPYDPVGDFEPIGQITNTTLLLVGHPSVPASNVVELIAYAKANPGKLTFGSSSASSRIAGEMLRSMAQIDIRNIPYKSNPQAATDLLGGQIDLLFADLNTTMKHVKAGTAKVFGLSRPSILAPTYPTMADAGVPGYNFGAWVAVYAPKATPRPIIKKLHEALALAMADKEVIEKIQGTGSEPVITTPDELRAFMASETKLWAELVKNAGIEPQ